MAESVSSIPPRRRRKRRAGRKTSSAPPPPPDAPKRPRPGRLSPGARNALAGIVLVVVTVLGLLLFVYPGTRGPGAGRDVEAAFPGDDSAEQLAGRLAAAGLVEHPRLFLWYLRVSGGAPKVAAGAHLLTDDLSPREILQRLERRGRGARMRVTFPEGFTRFDMAKRLQAQHVCSAKAFLDATADRALLTELRIDGESAEGFLFPATYDLPADGDASEVVRRMKAEFEKRWASLEQAHASGLLDLEGSLGWRRRDVVVLASMVEKEAAVDEERPVIASVFLNRLRDPAFKRKVLQSDPTSGYGCVAHREKIPACASFTGKITHDINMDPANEYSTYVHERLPPGPIANPGAKSLAAVLSPASTRFLFFVARGEGRHTFSESLDAHNAAVHGGGK
jgi:UPF0755 protein